MKVLNKNSWTFDKRKINKPIFNCEPIKQKQVQSQNGQNRKNRNYKGVISLFCTGNLE